MAKMNSGAVSREILTLERDHSDQLARIVLTDPDFTLYLDDDLADDNVIRVHEEIVRASTSGYFRGLLECGMTETSQRSVHLQNLDYASVKLAVDYMYGRSIQLDVDCLDPMLAVIEYFMYEELRDKLSAELIDRLRADNCIYLHHVAFVYNMPQLRSVAKEAVRIEFTDVAFSSEFLALPHTEVLECITHDPIPLTADTALKACLVWVMHDEEERKSEFPTLMDRIDIPACSPQYLKYTLQSFPDAMTSAVGRHRRDLDAIMARDIEPLDHVPTRESILMCSGQESYLAIYLNPKVYEINQRTNTVHHVATLPDWCLTILPALCATPQGIFGAGGKTVIDNRLASMGSNGCWLYNKYTRQVKALPFLAEPVHGAGATYVEGKVYLIGGHNDCSRDIQILNLSTNTWSPGPTMEHPVSYPKVASIDRIIYILHDSDSESNPIPLIQCLDTDTASWMPEIPLCPEITTTTESAMLSCDLGLFIVSCGKFACYDTINHVWTTLRQQKDISNPVCSTFLSLSPVPFMDTIVFWGNLNHFDVELVYDCAKDSWSYRPRFDFMTDLHMVFCTPI